MTTETSNPSVRSSLVRGADYATWGFTRGFVVTGWPAPAIPVASAPVVVRALIEGGTQVVVTGIRWDSTQVDLYKNGTTLVASMPVPAPFTTTVTFSGLSPFVVGDYYTARQTGPGGTSAASFRKACVQPAVLSIPPAAVVPPGSGFEGATWSPYWVSNLSLSPDQNHTAGGAQCAKEAASTFDQEAYTDLTPTAAEWDKPIVLTYWLYVDPASTNQTHYVRLWDFTGNGYGDGTVAYEFTVGVASDESVYTNGSHACTGCNPQYYQYRFVQSGSGGIANLKTSYMGDPWEPLRDTVAGWHKMQIKLGTGLRIYQETGVTDGPYAYFYADGLLGHCDYPATLPNIDSVTVGSKYSDALPGYYDDLSIAKVDDVAPTLPAAMTINAQEGRAITPYDVVGTDANDPDWLLLELVSGSLPAGLEASADYAYGPNTGVKITISGTPEAGTAAGSPYILEYQVSDERGAIISGTTGTLTINVSIACHTPPQDLDGDNDVDLSDFSTFSACFNGPNRPWAGPPIPQEDCACLDADKDLDVDLSDFSALSGCFNGPNRAPACP